MTRDDVLQARRDQVRADHYKMRSYPPADAEPDRLDWYDLEGITHAEVCHIGHSLMIVVWYDDDIWMVVEKYPDTQGRQARMTFACLTDAVEAGRSRFRLPPWSDPDHCPDQMGGD